MTVKTEVVRARVSPRIKADAERVLRRLGLTVSEAINLMLVQIKLKKGLPFEIKMPNAETVKAFEETDVGVGLKKAKSVDDMFDQIGD
jgi:DNA-damage-inducible protein J